MRKHTRCLALLVLAGLLLTACEKVKIADIKADPGRFRDKEVGIEGRVTGVSFGLLGMGVYQIDDGTGSLWVYSDKGGAPSEGARVGVKGKVVESITFLGRNYATILRESGRRAAGD
jgi:hypothetical protein